MECPKWSKDEGKYVFEQKQTLQGKRNFVISQISLKIEDLAQLLREIRDYDEKTLKIINKNLEVQDELREGL